MITKVMSSVCDVPWVSSSKSFKSLTSKRGASRWSHLPDDFQQSFASEQLSRWILCVREAVGVHKGRD